MQDRNTAVVDLDDYRRRRFPESTNHDEESKDSQRIIQELAYHLLKAIQAVKRLPH